MMHPGINQCDLTCKYLNWRAEEESLITSEASRSARLAFCSPSAAITLARASRAASASAAMALCSWTGKRTSLLQEKYQWLKMLLLVRAWKYVHFYPFHLDAPRLCCLVKSSLGKENIDSKALLTYEEISAMKYHLYLHGRRNTFAIAQDLMQRFGAQNISQSGLGQETRGVMGVFDVGHRYSGVAYSIIDHCIHWDCHRVSC